MLKKVACVEQESGVLEEEQGFHNKPCKTYLLMKLRVYAGLTARPKVWQREKLEARNFWCFSKSSNKII